MGREPVWPSGKAGKQKDIGSILLRLSFLFKSANGEPFTVPGSQQRRPQFLRPQSPTVGKVCSYTYNTRSCVVRNRRDLNFCVRSSPVQGKSVPRPRTRGLAPSYKPTNELTQTQRCFYSYWPASATPNISHEPRCC